jgi:hypothetical protein
MGRTFLRVIKRLKFLKDGSSIYIYDNGCKNTYALQLKDIVNHPVWAPESEIRKTEKSIHPSLLKYRKKFAQLPQR